MRLPFLSLRFCLCFASVLALLAAVGGYVYLSNTSELKSLGEENGVSRHAWVDGFGRPVMSNLGYSIMETVKTDKGEETRLLDTDGNLVDRNRSAAIVRKREWRADDWDCEEVRYFDKEGKPRQVEDGTPCLSTNILWGKTNEWGHLEKRGIKSNKDLSEKTFLGADGRPIKGAEGYATQRDLYQKDKEKGESLYSSKYFDENGTPCLCSDGYHERRSEDTEKDGGDGFKITGNSTKYLGINGEPVLNKSTGAHTTKSSGRRKEEGDSYGESASYGLEGELVRGIGSAPFCFAKLINKREGKDTIIDSFDEKGNPCPGHFGAERTIWKKNDKGRICETLHFHADGRPMNSLIDGVAVERMIYDSEDRIVRSEYVDESGKPAAFQGKCFSVTYEYPLMGGAIISCLGAEGKLVNVKNVERSYALVEFVPNRLHWLTKGKAGKRAYSKIILSDAEGKTLETIEGEKLETFSLFENIEG